MTRAFVLATAMPPTKGHAHLISFANRLGSDLTVIVATQPGEPYVYERVSALRAAFPGVTIQHLHRGLPQEPEQAAGFWDLWLGFLTDAGLQPGDYIVSSEAYGKMLADMSGAYFMPYDVNRSILYTKATEVRTNARAHFTDILPEFQPTIRQRITIFGNESIGKTTLSQALAKRIDGHWLFEWARPYLETVGSRIEDESMTRIWEGQRALQEHAADLVDKPYIVQDTDLYSTLGYWEHWAPTSVPDGLRADAAAGRSDLYIIPQSNIPFEPDPLRYGGDKRETTDLYWVKLAEREGLNYRVLDSVDKLDRLLEAEKIIDEHWRLNVHIGYNRITKESLRADGLVQ